MLARNGTDATLEAASVTVEEKVCTMRALLFLAGLVVMASALDAIALEGRYRQVAWQEAAYQGNKFNNGMRHWLQQLGLAR